MRDNFEDIVRSLLGGSSASVIKDTKLLLPCLDFFGDKPLDADEKEYLQSEILRLSESDLNFVQGYLHYMNEAYEDALSCYQKAADLGNVDAKYNLGYMNYHGKGCEVNCAGAILLFEEAIELEHMEAMFFRGKIYLFDKDDTSVIDYQKETDCS
jgi:TPR repeat protein